MVRVRVRVRAWARECTSCVFFFFSSGLVFVFGGSVSARRITYENSIDDVTATLDRGKLSLSLQCNMAQRAERVDVHACKTLSSGLREASFWPKNGLRSNLIDSEFQKIFWGGMPPDPPSCCVLRTHPNLTTPNLMATALTCPYPWYRK